MMLEKSDVISRIAIGMMSEMTIEIAEAMIEGNIKPEQLMYNSEVLLSDQSGISILRKFTEASRREALERAKREYDFIERHNIRVFSIFDDNYPQLLRQIKDPPITLYVLGSAKLDGLNIMSIVGTRKSTMYGYDFCHGFVKEMASYFPNMTIVSGLALGIDTLAHMSSLENDLPTIAVVAHGLDTLYPASNRSLAQKILKSGGAIVSEYPSGTVPFANRFLERNRIVAGLSHITIVVESDMKGGAMSTARLAMEYNREVGAVPGRINDAQSRGCNHLIRSQRAALVTSAADVIDITGWRPMGIALDKSQRNLFPELEGDAFLIYEALRHYSQPMTVDRILHATGIGISQLMTVLTELEFDGVINKLPGNRYTLA